MEKKYVANKGLLVNPQGHILFVRDAGSGDHTDTQGRWDLPGGHMESNETPLEGLVRELREEVHIEIDPRCARPIHAARWGIGGDVVNQPIIGIFYVVLCQHEKIELSSEHNEYRWVDPRQSVQISLFPFAQEALEVYRRMEGIVVEADDAIKGREGFGLIQLFTGNGKGKTTASIGEALRVHAVGKKVGIVFFDKGGNTHYSERKILDQLGIYYVATGRNRIDSVTGRFDFSIQEIDKTEATRGLEEAKKLFEEKYDLVVLDEINSTTSLGMISEQEVLKLIDAKPDQTELVLTGRNAPESFTKKAHLVTEMRLLKHYFYSGVPAREGLDF